MHVELQVDPNNTRVISAKDIPGKKVEFPELIAKI